jgi:hypothetical protein
MGTDVLPVAVCPLDVTSIILEAIGISTGVLSVGK